MISGGTDWRGLRADIARRLLLCDHDELRVLDELLIGLEHEREDMQPETEQAVLIADALRIVGGIVIDRDRRRSSPRRED